MVVFALCASKKQNSSLSTKNNNGEVEVLYELMDLDTRRTFNDSVNTSNSSNIDAELKFIETEVARETQDLHPRTITIPDAVESLLNEMKHQVGTLSGEITFLRQELKQKNHIVNFLMTENPADLSLQLDTATNAIHYAQIQSLSDEVRRLSDANKNIIENMTLLYNQANHNQSFDDIEIFNSNYSGDKSAFLDKLMGENILKCNSDARLVNAVDVRETLFDENLDELSLNIITSTIIYLMQTHTTNQKYDNVINVAPWEQYSNGFASKMLRKMGYSGRGLGKNETGIIEPLSIKNTHGRWMIEGDIPTKIQHSPQRVENYVHPWPINTTLIIGDSILHGVEEGKLKKYKAKVRVNPGSSVDDMYDYIAPLLKKKPTNIILHLGSNDSPHKSADDIYHEISNLKQYLEDALPGVNVIISCPSIRCDNINANHTLRKLEEKFKSSSFKIISNDNIDRTCLGRKGLHLNCKGTGRLAMNYISFLRRL